MIGLFFVFLTLSIIINVLVLWYIAKLLKKYIPISEDLEDLFERLHEYHTHIKVVSEMESFYGDEILMNLLRHSRTITNIVDEFRETYSLIDEEDPEDLSELEEGEELDDDQRDQKEDHPGEAKASLQRKVVFHQGA